MKSSSPRTCAIANCAICRRAPRCSTAHTLEIAGVQHFQDVLGLVPNLNWSAGTSRPRYFQMRGIGELEQWQGAPNPSVGFLIDGIDFSGVGMPATLSDVERIEVLRGPQGTAYGANALAGLIAVNTRAPRRESELNAERHGVGDYGTRGANGVLGGPIGEGEAAWRLVAGNYRSDGFRRDSYLRSRRHQRLRREQRATARERAAARDTCARTSPRCGSISTTATTRSRSTTRAPRCPTSPARTRRLARAGRDAARLRRRRDLRRW